MAEYRQLRIPPIQEALIDFRFQEPFDDVKAYDSVKANLSNQFPKVTNKYALEVQGKISNSEEEDPKPSLHPGATLIDGYQLRDEAERCIIQLNRGSFSCNITNAYKEFEELNNLLSLTLESLKSNIENPPSIKRIGVRTINDVKIPLGEEPINQSVFFLPSIPHEWPAKLENFKIQTTLMDGDVRIIVNNGVKSYDSQSNSVNLLFDIDCFYNFDEFLSLDKDFDEFIGNLRDSKNLIFFSSFSDEIIHQYE